MNAGGIIVGILVLAFMLFLRYIVFIALLVLVYLFAASPARCAVSAPWPPPGVHHDVPVLQSAHDRRFRVSHIRDSRVAVGRAASDKEKVGAGLPNVYPGTIASHSNQVTVAVTQETKMEFAPLFLKFLTWFGATSLAWLVGKYGLKAVIAYASKTFSVAREDFLLLEAKVRQLEERFNIHSLPQTNPPASPANTPPAA